MNKLTIIGNLTRDPELRTTSSGIQVCSFTVAVNRRRSSNADSGQPEADFFRVTAWRQLGEICSKYPDLYPVNYNSDGQVSVAGDKEQLQQMADDVKAERGLAKILDVSGAFHSPYMNQAAEDFAAFLADAEIGTVNIPVYSNRTALPYEGDYKQLLVEQIINPVYWKKLVRNMIDEGVDTFIELGPGKALTSMITRISKDVKMYRVSDMETLQKTVEGVKNNG